MTFYDQMILTDNGQVATPIHVVDKASFDSWLAAQPEAVRVATKAQKFIGGPNDVAILPGEKSGDWAVVAGQTQSA